MKNSKSAFSLRAFMVVFILLGAIAIYVLAQEQITLTTYYPSPYGIYNKVRLYPHDEGAACTPGELYYNSSGMLYMCDNTSVWVHAITAGASGNVTFGSGDIIFGGALRSTRTDGGWVEQFGNNTLNGLKWNNTWKDLEWYYNNTRAGFFDFQVQGLFANYSSNFNSDGGLTIRRTDDLISVSNSSKFQAAYPYQEQDLCIATAGRTTGGTNVGGWVKQCEPTFKPWTYNAATGQVYDTNTAWSVGIGTTTPNSQVHVYGTAPAQLNVASAGTTAGLRFQAGVAASAAQTAGWNVMLRTNSAAGNWLELTDATGALKHSWAGTDYVSGGRIGIGLPAGTSPAANLDIRGDDSFIRIQDNNAGGGRPGIQFANNTMAYISGEDIIASPQYILFLSKFSGVRTNDAAIRVYGRDATNSWLGAFLELTHDGTNGWIRAYNSAGVASTVNVVNISSRRWKENIVTLKGALADIKRLRGVRFVWDKAHGGKSDIGIIAEELNEVYPDLVILDEKKQPLGVQYDRLTAVLLEAIKEQQTKIESLEKRLEALESK